MHRIFKLNRAGARAEKRAWGKLKLSLEEEEKSYLLNLLLLLDLTCQDRK
jgi:hypothetical protein